MSHCQEVSIHHHHPNGSIYLLNTSHIPVIVQSTLHVLSLILTTALLATRPILQIEKLRFNKTRNLAIILVSVQFQRPLTSHYSMQPAAVQPGEGGKSQEICGQNYLEILKAVIQPNLVVVNGKHHVTIKLDCKSLRSCNCDLKWGLGHKKESINVSGRVGKQWRKKSSK